MSMPNALEGIAAQLVNRGLPVNYAERTAAELADHYDDLLAEQRAAGFDEAAADAEAARRLGDTRTLAKGAVREYRCRYWCGRWPLLLFVLAPLPLFYSVLLAACWTSIATYETFSRVGQWLGIAAPAPVTIALLKLVFLGGASVVVAPLVATFLFYRLAQRSGCGQYWALVSVGQVAFLASLLCFHMDGARGKIFLEPAMFGEIFFAPTLPRFLQSYFVQPSQAVQFMVPLAALGALVWYERRKLRDLDVAAPASIA